MELKNTCFVMFPKLLWISIHDKSSKTSNGDKSSNEDPHVNPTADEESHDHEQWRHRINLRSQQLCWQCQLGQTSRSFVGILNNPHQLEWTKNIGSFSSKKVFNFMIQKQSIQVPYKELKENNLKALIVENSTFFFLCLPQLMFLPIF